jgi:hypothetical protein
MSQKKMTPTIAKALAEQVRDELRKTATSYAETTKDKIKTSKEFKQLEKLMIQKADISNKMDEIKHSIEEKFSSKLADVSIYTYGSKSDTSITIRETACVSVEGIKNMILLEDYLSDAPESTEDLVKRIADKIMNSKH